MMITFVAINIIHQLRTTKNIKKLFLLIIAVYTCMAALFYFFQEKFIFHPTALPSDYKFEFSQPFKEATIPINAAKTVHIIQFTVPDTVCKGVALFFHGNTQNIIRYAKYASLFTQHNYEVWMIDYPGFGKSTGKITEQVLYSDAVEFYKLARSRFPKQNIILYGKSLGTGIASYIASKYDNRQLILESPYYSMDAAMRKYAFFLPIGILSKYHFPTFQFLDDVESPITIFHGTSDKTISYANAKKLSAKYPDKISLITINSGTHNNLSESELYRQTMSQILKH